MRKAFKTRVANGNKSSAVTHSFHNVPDILSHQPKWHKECYSSFTSKSNIQKVVKRALRCKPQQGSGSSQLLPNVSRITRKSALYVDWKMCIYCQKWKKREELHKVLSENGSEIIHHHARTNNDLKCSISLDNLIDNDAHYHS